jgi:hypothetical protein
MFEINDQESFPHREERILKFWGGGKYLFKDPGSDKKRASIFLL